jgi:hypothetical protein
MHTFLINTTVSTVSLRHVSALKWPSSGSTTDTFQQHSIACPRGTVLIRNVVFIISASISRSFLCEMVTSVHGHEKDKIFKK